MTQLTPEVRIVTDPIDYQDIPQQSEAETIQDGVLATALEHAKDAEESARLAIEYVEILKPATRNTVTQIHQLVMEIEELRRLRA